MNLLYPVPTLRNSQWDIAVKSIPALKRTHYFRIDIPVAGDAPKDIIGIYEYGYPVRKNNRNSWPLYIAKVGQKWYPMESVTEHLMNRIGEVIGVNMATSKLLIINGQLRFLSRYFLKKGESLVHGAEIYAGFIEDSDMERVHGIEKEGLSRNFFTFQFTTEAILSMFPEEGQQLLEEFVKLLVFDAITGNNDRHFYNWGVIAPVSSKATVRFSPVYDTARGLFWNETEEQLAGYLKNKSLLDARLYKYAVQSRPKTGWDGLENINHFDLIHKISQSNPRYSIICKELIKDQGSNIHRLIDKEFALLLSPCRKTLIKKLLTIRLNILTENIVTLHKP
ncbi:MAG: HipA domain-containing protein [Bacteroidia bacterium]|nr:HipA domain-containing protein [Bacteroidia bacterium]